MNQRFVILTFAACSVMFAGVWAVSAPTPHVAPPTATAPPTAVTYADCAAVRAAGAAPLRADQPGYRAALDANMNGVACESTGDPVTTATTAAPATAAAQPTTIESPPLPDLPPPPQFDLPPPDPATTRFPQLQ